LGGYLHFLFPVLPEFGAALSMFLLLLIANLTGIKQTARFELFVTVVAVFGLLLYLFLLSPYVSFANIPNFPKTNDFSFHSMFLSIPFAIWFFLAVEGVALAAEEVRNPAKDIPIGYTAGIFTLLLLASSVFVFTASVIDTKEVASLEYPLSYVLQKLYGMENVWPLIFTFIGLFGLIASLFGIILGNSRLLYAMAKEGYLPNYLSKLSKGSFVPQNAVFTGGAIGIFCMYCLETAELVTASALGACGMYLMSLVSYFVLRIKEPNLNRPYKTPFFPILPVVAFVLGVIACFAVVLSEPILALVVLVVGVLLVLGNMLRKQKI
ncbi:amino acid permease, partial [Leptospira sp. 96542]|nr:amino acid permease [Leptospira sp. 96542]